MTEISQVVLSFFRSGIDVNEHYFKLKRTTCMSPGFCSFFVITALIIQLVTLFHAQNVLFTAKGRYQVNFRIDTNLLQ